MTAPVNTIPDDHIAPDRYIDLNSWTLHDAAQQLATDRPENEPWIVLPCFDAGFRYGRSIWLRNLHQTDFRIYQHCTVAQVRQQLGITSILP